jgi:hypothetical protein
MSGLPKAWLSPLVKNRKSVTHVLAHLLPISPVCTIGGGEGGGKRGGLGGDPKQKIQENQPELIKEKIIHYSL